MHRGTSDRRQCGDQGETYRACFPTGWLAVLILASAVAACSDNPSWTPAVGAGPSGGQVSAGATTGGGGDGGGGGGETGCNDAEIDAIFALTPDLEEGKTQYDKSCGLQPCHGPDGVSGNGPDFQDVLPPYNDCDLMGIMLDGKSGMISLKMVFNSDQNFRDALAYVRAEF